MYEQKFYCLLTVSHPGGRPLRTRMVLPLNRLAIGTWCRQQFARSDQLCPHAVPWSSTALESLIHTSRNRSGYQFRTRTAKMAVAVGMPAFTEAEAQSFYDLRSHLAHGQETGQLSSANYTLYRLGEDVLRQVIARAILEPSFAATFANGPRSRGAGGK